MEKHEIKHIDKNIRSLVRNTILHCSMTSILKSKGILSEDDMDVLSVTRNNAGSRAELHKFYDLMKTKSSGFNALVEVLEETRQTGAVAILRGSKQIYETFLSLRLQILDGFGTVKDVLPSLTYKNSETILKKKLFQTETIQGVTCVKFYQSVPKVKENYVERFLSNKIVLSLDDLKVPSRDIFFIYGLTRPELASLVTPQSTMSSECVLTPHPAARFIHLKFKNTWQQFKDIATVNSPSFHLLRQTAGGGFFVVEDSSKPLQDTKPLENLSNKLTKQDGVSEDQFVTDTIFNTKTSEVFIIDIAGMGKTWLLQSLARKVQDIVTPFDSLVFLIQLPSLGIYINQEKTQQKLMNNGYIGVLAEYLTTSKLSKFLLINYLQEYNLNIILFLDALDEVGPNHIAKLNAFMEILRQNGGGRIKLIITSRPMKHFQHISDKTTYNILPFDGKDQRNALIKSWKRDKPDYLKADDEKLEQFARQCTQALMRSNSVMNMRMFASPLMNSMLSQLLKLEAWSLLKKSGNGNVLEKSFSEKSIFEFYDMFFEEGLLRVRIHRAPELITDECSAVALKQLYPEAGIYHCKGLSNTHNKTEFNIESLGFIESTKGHPDDLVFIHKSFAEYFAGKFFANFWLNCNDWPVADFWTVAIFFVKVLLQTNQENMTFSRAFEKDLNNKLFSEVLQYPRVLGFMDFILRKQANLNHMQVSFEELKGSLASKCISAELFPCLSKRREILNRLKSCARSCLLGCLEEGLTCTIVLLKNMIDIFVGSETKHLLTAPKEFFQQDLQLTELAKPLSGLDQQVYLAHFVNFIASKGSADSANQLFILFEDCKTVCNNFPPEMKSPLDFAIQRTDMDLFYFFLGIVPYQGVSIILKLMNNDSWNDQGVETRIEMLKGFLWKEPSAIEALDLRKIQEHVKSVNGYVHLSVLSEVLFLINKTYDELSSTCKASITTAYGKITRTIPKQ